MGNTLIEKIIAHNIGRESVKPDEIVTVYPNRVMIHDIFVPFVANRFEEMGFTKIWDTERVVLINDHLIPAAVIDDARHTRISNEFAAKYNLHCVHSGDGICHQLMVEQGYVKPGDIVFGTDSHTTTYGAVGSFSTGIGYTEMSAILGTGEIWIKVPRTIQVTVEGKLSRNVCAKDVILRLLGDLGADGANYCALEFVGSTIREMSLSSRMTIANMAVEAGAKCAVFETDEKSLAYVNRNEPSVNLQPDKNANYYQKIYYDAEKFEPVIACPSQVDNIHKVEELVGTPIDQVFIGSCTNGRLEDIEIVARILDGKKISSSTRMIITPASREIYGKAAQNGLLEILIRAGAAVTMPGCGLCCGRTGGILADGERVLATNNRNFLGRMGSEKVEIYLSSPAVAAVSALNGTISLPTK